MLLMNIKLGILLRRWTIALILAFAAVLPVLAGPQFVVALHGYDPVAYFTDGKPVLGDLRFTYFWNGQLGFQQRVQPGEILYQSDCVRPAVRRLLFLCRCARLCGAG